MKKLLVLTTLSLLTLGAGSAFAQTATVIYDAPAGTTVAQNQAWTPILYVNGTAFGGTLPTCTGTTTITCTFLAPNFQAALTPSGIQTFALSLKDAVLGEGPKSSPLLLTRPGAPFNLRLSLVSFSTGGRFIS